MTTPDTLLGAVADAIATADMPGATYEELAKAALAAVSECCKARRSKYQEWMDTEPMVQMLRNND